MTLGEHVRVYEALETLWCAPNSARCGVKALAAVRAASPRIHFFIASSRKWRGHSHFARAHHLVLREAVVATCAVKAATPVYTFAHINKVVNRVGLLCSQRGPARVHTVYTKMPEAQLRVVRTELLRPSRYSTLCTPSPRYQDVCALVSKCSLTCTFFVTSSGSVATPSLRHEVTRLALRRRTWCSCPRTT